MIKVKELLREIVKGVKKLWNKGKWGKVIVVIGSMAILGAILPDSTNETTISDEPIQMVDKSTEQKEEKIKEAEVVKTPKENFEQYISNIYKELYKIDIDSESSQIIISSNIKDNLTSELIKVGFESDIYDILKENQNNEYLNQYKSICFVGETMFINKYGEEIKGNGFIYTFDMEDIKRVNFDNIYYNDLVELTKSKFIHPSFSR